MKKLFVLTLLFLFVFTGIAMADNEITIRWDKNTETDLAGYRLYQSDVSDGQIVDGVSFVAEILPDSGLYDHGIIPDLDPAHDAFTLTSVPDGTWYWILTAFDTSLNESGKSNEVSASVDSTAPGAPVILDITAKVSP
jgi:hypothetical protein